MPVRFCWQIDPFPTHDIKNLIKICADSLTRLAIVPHCQRGSAVPPKRF